MKVLYVTTVSGTINAFLIPHIKMLVKLGHKVDIACNITSPLIDEVFDLGCKVHEIEFNRSPLNKNNIKAYKKLSSVIIQNNYELVHTHTPIASAIVRLVCKNIDSVKVCYTAHGFHFYKGASIKSWVIYYPIEKWLSRYTDTLITINKEDYERATKSLSAKKVKYIPGVGLDVDKFRNIVVDKNIKRQEINIPKNSFVVLSVGEVNKNKNHEVIIKAIAKLDNPLLHYVICGRGPLESYLKNIARELGIQKQVHLLGFRKDIAEICKASDVFAFPSLREGLGMAALEAMACGLPIITTNVHGILDYSVNGETGYTCKHNDVDGFATAIDNLLYNDKLRNKIKNHNLNIVKMFDKQNSITEMSKIYSEVFQNA